MGLLDGFPAGFQPNKEAINQDLKARQGGYGRGDRQKIEQDTVEFLTGIYQGVTNGAPISLWVKNKDFKIDTLPPVPNPRPGHADLAGAIKYGFDQARPILERASARETAARVAAGSLCRQCLARFGVEVLGHVLSIGSLRATSPFLNTQANTTHLALSALRDRRAQSAFYFLDPDLDQEGKQLVDEAKTAGDTLGGEVEIVVTGLPIGLGSHTQWDARLDGQIAQVLMSIQAVKGVEIGLGFSAARLPGSKVQDPIEHRAGRLHRRSNNAGGLEGGITNGEPLIVRVAFKPISTLMTPLDTIDLVTGVKVPASTERSDTTAVPAASIVAEAALAIVLLKVFLEKFGGDQIAETCRNLEGHRAMLAARLDAWEKI